MLSQQKMKIGLVVLSLVLLGFLVYLVLNQKPQAATITPPARSGFYNVFLGNYDYTLSELKKFNLFFTSELARITGVGDDHAIIKDKPQIDFTTAQDFTIGFWVKWSAANNDSGASILEKWAGGDGVPYSYIIRTSDVSKSPTGPVIFARYDGNTSTSTETTRNIGDNNWHYITASHKASDKKLSLYVDGQLDSSNTYISLGETRNNDDLFLGSRGGQSNFFKGAVDELKIWNLALTDAAVQQEFSGTPQASGLVAFYNFNETAGTLAKDSSSYANDATLKGCLFAPGKSGNALLCQGDGKPISYETLKNNNPTANHFRYLSAITIKDAPETPANCPIFFDYQYIAQNHPEWFLTVNSQKVTWPGDGSRFVLDVRNPQLQTWAAGEALKKVKNTTNNPSCLPIYDGLSFDNVIFALDWWTPSLNGTISKDEWFTGFAAYLTAIKNKLNQNGFFLLVNTGGLDKNSLNDLSYWNRLFDSIDGIQFEQPFGGVNSITGRFSKTAPAEWDAQMEIYESALTKGKKLMLGSVTSTEAYSATIRHNEALYTYASYLLLKTDNSAFYSNTMGKTSSKKTEWFPEFEIYSGNALNNRSQSNGLWTRDFTNLKVVFNPSDSAVNFTASGDLYAIGGGKISTISIPSRSGRIYLKYPALISKQTNTTAAASGQTLTYTLTLTNYTTQTITSPKISDNMPAGTTFVSASTGYQLVGSTLTWNLSNLGPNATSSVSFKVKIP